MHTKFFHTILFVFIFISIATIFVWVKTLTENKPLLQTITYSPSPEVQLESLCVEHQDPLLSYIIEGIGGDRVVIGECEKRDVPSLVLVREQIEEYVGSERIFEDDELSEQLSEALKEDGGFFWFSSDGVGQIASYVARVFSEVDREGAYYYLDRAYSLEYRVLDLFSRYRGDEVKEVRSHGKWAPFIHEFRGSVRWQRDDSLSLDQVFINGIVKELDPFAEKEMYGGLVDFLSETVSSLLE